MDRKKGDSSTVPLPDGGDSREQKRLAACRTNTKAKI